MKSFIFCFTLLFFATVLVAQQTEDSSKAKKNKYVPTISGLIQVHYLNEFNTNGDSIRDPDGFRILRARFATKGNISKKVTYDLMIDPRAPEQGGILRDAYIGLHYVRNQEIRIGQQKTQFGWENRESVSHLYTVNRAELSDGAARGYNLRDIGVGIIGNINLNGPWRLENALTITNGTRMNVTGPYDFNNKMAVWGRLGVRYKTDVLTLRLGGSFGFGGIRDLGDTLTTPSDDFYYNFNRVGFDLQADHSLFFVATEFAMGTDKIADTITEEPIGYQAILALKSKWHVGPLVRYDVFEDEWEVCTVGAYYGEPKDRLRVLINYLFRGNITDIPGGHDDRFYMQMQLTF